MHCNEEELVAYLDGELPRLRKYRVQRHLEACWPCRTRLATTESAIQRLTKEIDEWSFPQPGWTAEGKLRLNRGIRAFESGSAARANSVGSPWSLKRWVWGAMAAAAMAAVILFAVVPKQRVEELPIAADAITRAAAVESALYTQPVQQTFAVEIAELRPNRNTRSTRLEVWADRPTGRFASRWVGDDGVLRHAVWRPGRGVADFLYSPAVSSKPVRRMLPSLHSLPISSLAEYGLDLAQIESAFLRWLETGAGRAVSFTSDLAVWSHQDGTAMKAELLRADGASPAIRVTAQRKTRMMTAVLHVDFDADSYRPRLQTIRFETPERAVEFRIAATRIKRVSSTELQSSLFSPEMGSFGERPFPELPASSEQFAVPRALAPTPYSSFKADGEMLEAHYVLHQAGACLGEPVRIEQQQDGIQIRNRSRGSWSQSFLSMAQLEVVLDAFAELRDAAPPAATDLPEGADAGFGSATALRHAWALRRLARLFPVERTEKLLPEHWRLLEIMVRDHVTRIDSELERVHLQQSQDTAGRPPQREWRYSSSILFEALLNARELLRDEPIAKIAPMLQEVDTELHGISLDFSSEYLRSQAATAKHPR